MVSVTTIVSSSMSDKARFRALERRRPLDESGGILEESAVMIAVSLTAALALAAQSTQAAPPGAMLLAQAHDRCMTTYAVRLTRTAATDDAIYAEAVAGCKGLKDQLSAGIARDYAPTQAAELTAALESQARPNFLTLLQRIRADRISRAGN